MKISTQSNVNVSVTILDGVKVLSFDRPVKQIELNREESSRLGSSLIRDMQTGITREIRERLIASNFFSAPKSFGEIKSELYKLGIPVKPGSLNVVLSKMVDRGELRRNGQKKSYLYQQSD